MKILYYCNPQIEYHNKMYISNHVLMKFFDIYECYTSTVNFFDFSPNQKTDVHELKVIK